MSFRLLAGIGCCLLTHIHSQAQDVSQILDNPHGFEMKLWAREPLLRNPVALSFDDKGRLFVVETSRRGTVDIDIRSHKSWAYDDLKNQSIAQLRLFFREKMSSEKSAENASWLKDRNQDGSHDWRDLMTLKERVYRIEDTDGDHVADRSQIFYEGFNEEFNGVIAGVMPWKDDVWVTVYPDLWRFHDANDDGIADPNDTRVRGFGVHAAYDGHDIHGLTLGPEGKLYFSVGDNGFSVVTLEGNRLHYPNTGGVLRMDPDGSNLEVFAYGLRNVQEIAFDEYGNLFSVDNDGDIEDERERFVYITEGSDSGWRLNWQFRNRGWTKTMDQPFYNPWIHEKMWIPFFEGQAAHITPPLSNYSVGPGGFKFNPGTALTPAYKDYFFLAQFPVQKITAFRAEPKGASFEMSNEHVFHFGLMASAMNFGPDGAMYIADWDGKWQPNEKGAIHRLDDPEFSESPVRREVEQLLQEGFQHRSLEELATLLGHADQRIRQRAQGALAASHAGSLLLEIAQSDDRPELARIHALWGLSEMKADGMEQLGTRLPFGDRNPEIRAQAAKVAGDLRLSDAAPSLAALISNASFPRVQFHAALAAGKLREPSLSPALITMLKTSNNRAPFLRHAGIMGLAGCLSETDLATLREHASGAVRTGAVNALRRVGSARVADFLSDPDIGVVREAVRAIHDDFSIPEAMPSLARLLDNSNLADDEPIMRRALNTNLRLGGRSNAQRLLQYAQNTALPSELRQEAIECLRVWNQRPYLDRVEGRARRLSSRDPEIGNQLLQQNAMALFQTTDAELRATLTKAIRRNGLKVPIGVLHQWLNDPKQSEEIRLDALRLIQQEDPDSLVRSVKVAMDSKRPALRLAALEIEAQVDGPAFLARHASMKDYSLREQQQLIALLRVVPGPQSELIASNYRRSLKEGTLAAELALDVSNMTTERGGNPSRPRSEWDYQYASIGGDPKRGQEVYRNHVAAQCVRCHNAGGQGKQVGPVLTGIGQKQDQRYLLESILNPSASIADGFQTVSVETNEGDAYDGVIISEDSEELVLGVAAGEPQVIPKNSIFSRSASKVSAMPSMKGILSPIEVRDLVAYLKQL